MPFLPYSLAFAALLAVPLRAQSAGFTYQSLAPTVIQFTDTSTGGTPIQWMWDFEDDGVVDDTSRNPTWTYATVGVFRCRLTVDFGTSTSTIVRSVFVEVMPMPGFGNTFSSGNRCRGFWFQAPTPFSIVGLRVPDEFGHGQQNVAVYRLFNTPPLFPNTAMGGRQFSAVGRPSGTTIPCAVSFDTGELVGVLGACGDTTTMHSSYANVAGPQPSSVLGIPTTITRFNTQTNIASNFGVAPYSQSPSAQLGRVFVTYTRCVSFPYGIGTPSSQAPEPILRTTRLPQLGTTSELTLENSDANAIGVLAVGIGRLNFQTSIGTLLINNIGGSVTLNGGALMNPGLYPFQFAIPADPSLQGFMVNWQAATYVTGTAEFAMSNANEWTLDF